MRRRGAVARGEGEANHNAHRSRWIALHLRDLRHISRERHGGRMLSEILRPLHINHPSSERIDVIEPHQPGKDCDIGKCNGCQDKSTSSRSGPLSAALCGIVNVLVPI